MKRVILVTFALLLLLTGCIQSSGSYNAVNYYETSGDGYWYANHEAFDGYKQKVVSLSGDKVYELDAALETKSGTLKLTIEDDNGTIYCDGDDLSDGPLSARITGVKKLTIRVDAEACEGSFDITWNNITNRE